jgi:hypothetical protein
VFAQSYVQSPDIHHAFFELDLNKDGILRQEEIRYVDFSQVDKDGDQGISFEEFIKIHLVVPYKVSKQPSFKKEIQNESSQANSFRTRQSSGSSRVYWAETAREHAQRQPVPQAPSRFHVVDEPNYGSSKYPQGYGNRVETTPRNP